MSLLTSAYTTGNLLASPVLILYNLAAMAKFPASINWYDTMKGISGPSVCISKASDPQVLLLGLPVGFYFLYLH